MSPERTLDRLLRLRAAMDAALSHAVPVGDDEVRVLVGLLDALDHALCLGAPIPARWASASAPSARPRVVSLDPRPTPANDNASRRRQPRVRTGPDREQLALPWTASPLTAR
jgi:hypothetical protein